MSDRLDAQQRQAVEHDGGPMLVLAGPGTGKTRVITQRIAHLIRERGVRPETIVALTFTVKSAAAMRQRLSELVGVSAAESVNAGTFHGFAKLLVRRFPDRLGFERQPTIMDSAMRRRLLREVVTARAPSDAAGASQGESWIDELRAYFSQLHNHAISPEQAHDFAERWGVSIERGVQIGSDAALDDEAREGQAAQLVRFKSAVGAFEHYERERRARCWMGFDELLIEPVRLLRTDRRAAAICRDDYRHFVVDEYQDTNAAQAELLAMLAPPEQNRDLVVVGDDDQSIYDFRGADDLAFDRFARRWKGCKQVRLERNYRSRSEVIAAANAVIGRAYHRFAQEKKIEPGVEHPESPGRVELIELQNYADDGDAIASMIRADRESSLASSGEQRPWSHYAVIVRSHGDANRVGMSCDLLGIPYSSRQGGGDGPVGDMGVRRLLSWLELLANPQASWAARGVLLSPPICVPPESVLQLEKEYHALRSRGKIPSGFASWLSSRQVEDEDAHARGPIERFCTLYDDLQAVAREQTAEQTVIEVVRRAGLAESELLSGRERVSRVRNLVQAIRFVRSMQPRLPQPGDIDAFWSYYNDLDPKDQSMDQPTGEDAIDRDEDADPGEGQTDSVTILTAHSAKGLEFDTVFIPRVFSPHGYPLTRSRDNEPLPTGLIDSAGVVRSEKEKLLDEERRLFYVALTRAERRVVLFTNKTKSKTATINFAKQLAEDLGERMIRINEGEVLVSQREALDHELAALAQREASMDRSRAALRSAGEAMAQAGSAKSSDELEQAIESLRNAALAVASEGYLQRGEEYPAWLGKHAPVVHTKQSTTLFKPVRGPLRLSYTLVNNYLRCPRCWYLDTQLGLSGPQGAPMLIGSVAHKALQKYYEQIRQAEAEGAEAPGVDVLEAHAIREYMGALPYDEPVNELEKAQIIGMVVSAHQKLHEPHAEVLELERLLSMPWEAAGKGSTMEARIDRLDRLGEVHRLVDYKTGQANQKLLEPKSKDLQMALYALVIKELMGIEKGYAEYWLLRTGERGRIALEDLDTQWAVSQVAEAVEGIRKGNFEQGKGCVGDCDWIESTGLQRETPSGVGEE